MTDYRELIANITNIRGVSNVAVKVSKLYKKIKGNSAEFEELFHKLSVEHKDGLDVDEFQEECRFVIILDVKEEHNLKTDAYIVLSGLYNKSDDTFNYEGVFEGVEFFNYEYQGEVTRGDLYQNLVNELITLSVKEPEESNPPQRYITENAIDILSMFHIYNKGRYVYTVGLDMMFKLSEDGEQLTADEGVTVYTENNLHILKIMEQKTF